MEPLYTLTAIIMSATAGGDAGFETQPLGEPVTLAECTEQLKLGQQVPLPILVEDGKAVVLVCQRPDTSLRI